MYLIEIQFTVYIPISESSHIFREILNKLDLFSEGVKVRGEQLYTTDRVHIQLKYLNWYRYRLPLKINQDDHNTITDL